MNYIYLAVLLLIALIISYIVNYIVDKKIELAKDNNENIQTNSEK